MSNQRTKTTIMLPNRLLKEADEMGRILGTGRNGFLAVAAGLLLAKTESLRSTSMRRGQRLKILEAEIQKVMREAQERA